MRAFKYEARPAAQRAELDEASEDIMVIEAVEPETDEDGMHLYGKPTDLLTVTVGKHYYN